MVIITTYTVSEVVSDSPSPNENGEPELLVVSSSTITTSMTSWYLPVSTATIATTRPWEPPSPLGPIPPGAEAAFFNLRTELDFLTASAIPVLLATLLAIPIEILVNTLSYMLPVRALGQPGGATAEDSVFLGRLEGSSLLTGPLVTWRFMQHFSDPLPLLNLLLSVSSILLVPLSSEVIRLEFLPMSRQRDDNSMCSFGLLLLPETCGIGLRKAGAPMRVAEGMLVLIAALVIGIGVILSRWQTGVAAEPWSIASMASLLQVSKDGQLGHVLRSIPPRADDHCDDRIFSSSPPQPPPPPPTPHDESTVRALAEAKGTLVREGTRFQLGSLYQGQTASTPDSDHQPDSCYGIIEMPPIATDDKLPIQPTTRNPPKPPKAATTQNLSRKRRRRPWYSIMSPSTMEQTIQVLALVLVTGLLILILYYENTINLNTTFEAFMDSQSFGVRILFTAFGTAVSRFWAYYYCLVFEPKLHHRLATNGPQPARKSILLTPPSSNVFAGLGLRYSLHNIDDILSLHIAIAALPSQVHAHPLLQHPLPQHRHLEESRDLHLDVSRYPGVYGSGTGRGSWD
ncbi:hypothetical protein B0H63DRAFT_462420 [Podospora didyma]|uniref:Uncharacterized protein n=1 Tax=Podospora didyma TaxID=330526 RepID=A0AAE0P8E7_9PEZI|nr:hypothetical protein B0H63DRAFT_462420 [Podospora didyma]